MSQLKLFLLGKVEAIRAGGTQVAIRSEREQALFVYLALESRQMHRREHLASLLWPDVTEEQARNSLRVTLHRLRNHIQIEGKAEELILASRDGVQLNPDRKIWIDITEFLTLIASVEAHNHESLDECADCLEALEAAVILYEGEFLGSWTLYDSQQFYEWVVLKQELFHRRALDALSYLTDSYYRTGQWHRAEIHVRRQLELEPWREEAHRHLMLILAARGARSAALAQYELCMRVLAEELSASPSSETTDIYHRIRDEEIGTADPKPRSQTGPEPQGQQTADKSTSPKAFPWRKWGIGLLFSAILLLIVYLGSSTFLGASTQIATADLILSDNFDDREFEGQFNEALWFEIGNPQEVCPLSQATGNLLISEAPTLSECGNKLRIRKPLALPGNQLRSLEARMKISDSHNGGIIATVLSWVTGFPNGAWIVDCGIFGDDGSLRVDFVVSDTRLISETGDRPLHLSSIPIRYDTWYTVRLQLDPQKMEFSCWLDGEEMAHFAATNVAHLQSAPFNQEINSWRLNGAVGTVLVDDVSVVGSD
ncbi:MAG: hypothetical protein DWQ07_17015 [Chloroflexi bacterium]|nr:MAG: hypothetical protein DWQ07_17015 [Chloroflexota bacterium]MBL1195106.1 hypothetical protein [Chloroflexota bacterium]NOH12392.1 hypothetical protein [Chloroflexota bacterium]